MPELDVRFIANNDESRSRGLMYSDPLGDHESAWFVFPFVGTPSFWNKNVNFPISLGFLDDNFKLEDIGSLDAHQEKSYVPKSNNIKYVVELPRDFFQKYEIKKNDYIILKGDKAVVVKS